MSTSGLQTDENSIDARYKSALDDLFRRINYETRPDQARSIADFQLERMRRLLELLGNPQTSMPCVHIAGSKGKGSTAVMVARILEAAGFRVGLFTSPHAHRYEERFAVNQVIAQPEEVVALVDQLKLVVKRIESESIGTPTFFELTTAAGWLHFRKQNVDIAVIEVGLGGRLDTTNVCNPAVSVVTSISKDHTRLLGDTEELIAREKAGIIKQGIPVVSGVTKDGPQRVIHEVAAAESAPIHQLGEQFSTVSPVASSDPLTPWSFDYSSDSLTLNNVQLAMLGQHQTRNAAVAIAAVTRLDQNKFPVNEQQIREGLRSANLPLRIQALQRDPTLVVDAAHNVASAQALSETLKSVQARKRVCIFSSSRDKDVAEILRILSPSFDHFVLTSYQTNPRAISLRDLEELASKVLTGSFETAKDPEDALTHVLEIAEPEDLICATGSFFLAAEVENIWRTNFSNPSDTK